MTLRVAIAGASGYAGGEVARLLSTHPKFDVVTLAAHSSAGASVRSVHPHLHSFADRHFSATSAEVLAGHDVIVLALPHGASGVLAGELRSLGGYQLLIDVGADHRLESPEAWSEFYGGEFHEPFVYGMPELPRFDGPSQRERIVGAREIVIPGCNATAVTLALAPLLNRGVMAPTDLSATLAVGSSGAGRTLRHDLLASELSGSAKPYAVGGVHRHIPEILQNLSHASGLSSTLWMNPVLVPMSRGILATCSGVLSSPASVEDIRAVFLEAYGDEPFVSVYPAGSFPSTGDVVGSNTIALGVAREATTQRVIIVAALDNLVKGTAGAAVQCMNIALGFPETLGLGMDGVAP